MVDRVDIERRLAYLRGRSRSSVWRNHTDDVANLLEAREAAQQRIATLEAAGARAAAALAKIQGATANVNSRRVQRSRRIHALAVEGGEALCAALGAGGDGEMTDESVILERVHEGNGTLDDPDVYRCPLCGAPELRPDWDETASGQIIGTGDYLCNACGYEIRRS